jgi:hypothetical protein
MALLLAAPSAWAHGIWGHIHVTGWAITNLPPGELRDFFNDDAVMNAALYGAAFTDSGYWPQAGAIQAPARNYGEHSHWEPFVEDFIQWIRANDPPPWTDLESRQRVAFLMGVAAHGMQDELFDSTFLYHAEEKDTRGQDNVDPASDGFLMLAGVHRWVPTPWYPTETLLELYEVLDDDRITADVIDAANDLMTLVYVNDVSGIGIATSNGNQYARDLPWTQAHNLDTNIPGSLRAEIIPTGRYLEAIWERLHGRWTEDQLIIHTWPDPPRRLLSGNSASVESWITVVAGRGIRAGTASITLEDAEGNAIPFDLRGTRWGGLTSWGRLARAVPRQDLDPGAEYRLAVGPGLDVIGVGETDPAFARSLQVDCTDEDDPRCPPLTDLFEPDITPPPVPEPEPEPEPDPTPDAGTPDAGTPDAGGQADATTPPTPPAEDAALPPGGPDAGMVADAATTADPPAASGGASQGGCTGAPQPAPPAWPLALGLVLGVVARARRLRG